VALHRGAPPPGEKPEPLVQPGRDLSGAHPHNPRCGQLDGQGDPIQAPTDLADGAHVRPVDHEAGAGRRRPLPEQPHGLTAHGGVEIAVNRDGQRRQRHQLLARYRQTLPARGQDPHLRAISQYRLNKVGGRAQEMLAIVQHHQQLLGPQVLPNARRQRHPCPR